ncbi:acyltransferase family protein [Paracoccus lutimaris]|uniref:Surface polysaccharide O-acyltransferase-like enzyme n=1 Tax=Paracoccus lutimaris TaxID=1490030 RepID=A0A368YT99_9RHOB|nr:acyltransferase family protein [Paracoccus lutimaris]RCW83442.1 surface polysaccharide O-acyltransferase-like enzyme [Paracoccus lutimaris]
MNRIHSLDYLKLALAVLVAFGHTYWLQSHMSALVFMIGNGLMRVMVPTFCIVVGYFLFSAVARGKSGKWLWRVLALYMFWMLVYLPFWLNEVHGPVSLIKTLLLGFFHLWFMAGIVVAGTIVIGLRLLVRAISPALEVPALIVTSAICAAIGVAMQYASLAGLAEIGVRKFENGVFMCFPFVAIGYLIGRRVAQGGMQSLPARPLVLAATVLGAGLLMIEARLVELRWGDAVMLDIPISAYVAAPALFLPTLGTRLPQPAIRLDPISAAIYFMHVLALKLAGALGVTDLAGLMLFAIGLPTLLAVIGERLAIPILSRGGKNRAAGEYDSRARAPRT